MLICGTNFALHQVMADKKNYYGRHYLLAVINNGWKSPVYLI